MSPFAENRRFSAKISPRFSVISASKNTHIILIGSFCVNERRQILPPAAAHRFNSIHRGRYGQDGAPQKRRKTTTTTSRKKENENLWTL